VARRAAAEAGEVFRQPDLGKTLRSWPTRRPRRRLAAGRIGSRPLAMPSMRAKSPIGSITSTHRMVGCSARAHAGLTHWVTVDPPMGGPGRARGSDLPLLDQGTDADPGTEQCWKVNDLRELGPQLPEYIHLVTEGAGSWHSPIATPYYGDPTHGRCCRRRGCSQRTTGERAGG